MAQVYRTFSERFGSKAICYSIKSCAKYYKAITPAPIRRWHFLSVNDNRFIRAEFLGRYGITFAFLQMMGAQRISVSAEEHNANFIFP